MVAELVILCLYFLPARPSQAKAVDDEFSANRGLHRHICAKTVVFTTRPSFRPPFPTVEHTLPYVDGYGPLVNYLLSVTSTPSTSTSPSRL